MQTSEETTDPWLNKKQTFTIVIIELLCLLRQVIMACGLIQEDLLTVISLICMTHFHNLNIQWILFKS